MLGRKLSRDHGSRKALFRSLIKALIKHGSMITTKAKAKSVQVQIDKYISLVKKGDANARRQVFASLSNDKESVKKLFGEISKAFVTKESGFTRMVNLPQRRGDNAEIVRLEWSQKISLSEESKSKKGKNKTKSDETESKNVKSTLRSRISSLGKAKSKK